MHSDSVFGAIPAFVSRLLSQRRSGARVTPAKPVVFIEETRWVLIAGVLIGMIGFGLPGALGGKLIAGVLAASFVLASLRRSGLIAERIIGAAPSWTAYALSAVTLAIVLYGAFINPAAYWLLGAAMALFVVRMLRRLLPVVHEVAMERYAGHVARMEADQAARKQ